MYVKPWDTRGASEQGTIPTVLLVMLWGQAVFCSHVRLSKMMCMRQTKKKMNSSETNLSYGIYHLPDKY
jgi:hypothetical protein